LIVHLAPQEVVELELIRADGFALQMGRQIYSGPRDKSVGLILRLSLFNDGQREGAFLLLPVAE
jgi:hypothetical protein